MKTGRYIIYAAIPLIAGLLFLLGWNTWKLYLFEQKQVREKVELSVRCATDTVLNHNGTIVNNYARMLTDKDFREKLAFAVGFTRNRSKLLMTFDENDTTRKQNLKTEPKPAKDSRLLNLKTVAITTKVTENSRVGKNPGKSTTQTTYTPLNNGPLHVTKEWLVANHIEYKPQSIMNIHHFDSLFKTEMKKNKITVPYRILIVQGREKAGKDTIISEPFILDFTQPVIYSVHYLLPASQVLQNMFPYLLSTTLLSVMLIFGTVFFYRSYRSQQQQAQFRQSLFGNITHELKTPLTSMQLIIDDAKKHISDDAIVSIPAKHVEFAENELNRMKLIVDNILSFSKMGREQFSLNQERVDLDHVITEAMKIMEIKILKTNGTISYEGGNKLMTLGDVVLLINAVSAIIDNAIKYAHLTTVINISLRKDSNNAIIAIRDNGIGIPPQYGKKIFEPFFRVPTGNIYNAAGHGLGLSFVKQVMALHKGKISFISDSYGTTFYLTFTLF